MPLTLILKKIPSYLPNLKKNFEDFLVNYSCNDLTPEQTASVCLAISYSLKNELLINHFKYEASINLEEDNITDIKAAVIMIIRDNLFYQNINKINNEKINDALADFADNVIAPANIDRIVLIMCMLVVSIINDCSYCIDLYTQKLLNRMVSEQNILTLIKIAAILKSLSTVLEVDSLRNYEFITRGESI